MTTDHNLIIIDDLKMSFMSLRELCRLADTRFPLQLRTSENTFVTLNERRVTVTSLYSPETLFEEDVAFDRASRTQLCNRFRVEALGQVNVSEDESTYDSPTTSDEDFIVSDSEYD